jgi:hypothetical protein
MIRRRSALAAALLALPSLQSQAQAAAGGRGEISTAERLLFVDPHLKSLRPPRRLRYRFVHREPSAAAAAFDDDVTLALKASAGGACCAVAGQFLSGTREVRLPQLDDAQSNPVTLFFLEREVREMQRSTGGQAAHFRRRIRVALAESTPRPTTLRHDGRDLKGQEIVITPYADDPMRHRFERQAGTRYRFVLSPDVPGTLWRIEAELAGTRTDTLTLLETER